MQKFEFLTPVFDAFEAEGFKAFLVGGCVRDHLLNQRPGNNVLEINDFDLTTDCLPVDIERILRSVGAHIHEKKGGNFGTVACMFDSEVTEVTTHRADVDYPMGSRRPEVEFSTNLDDDLSRRDFTINALAMDRHGSVTDLFNGLNHLLVSGRLTSPQDPVKLMSDDPLRILRAYRFAHRFELQIDLELRMAMRRFATNLSKEIGGERIIKNERIHDELLKIAATATPHLAFREMMEDGVMQQIFPELCNQVGYDQCNVHHHLPLWEHTLLTVQKTKEFGGGPLAVLAALLHDVAKPVACQVVLWCETCSTKFRVSDSTSMNEYKWIKIESCKCVEQDNRVVTQTGQHSFHRHDEGGAVMVDVLLKRFKFSTSDREAIVKMVAKHIEYSREGWTAKAARRFVNEMGGLTSQMVCLLKGDRAAHAPGHNDIEVFEGLERLISTLDMSTVVNPKLPIDGHMVMALLNLKAGAELGRVMKTLKQAVIDGEVVTEEDAIALVSQWVLDQKIEV
jgi:poly(A) polymerase